MPRPPKKAKQKTAKPPVGEQPNGAPAESDPVGTAVAEPPAPEELQPPTRPVEMTETAQTDGSGSPGKRRDRSPTAEGSPPEPTTLERSSGRPGNRRQEERMMDDKDHIA